MTKKVKKPINRKGPEKPRGLNVRGLPKHVTTYLENTAKAKGLSTEAYVRSEIIKHVDEKLNPTERTILIGEPFRNVTGNDPSIQTS